jgi:MarR family transcriptional regulator for hemolysin
MAKDMAHSIGFKLAKVLKLKRRYIDIEMKALGLSRTQWQTLTSLNILGPCAQKDLLKNMDIDAAHLARVLESLEKSNYIIRTPIKNNRRSLLVQMTPQSQKRFVPLLEKTLTTENALLLKNISTADQKKLKALLEVFITNMEHALNDQ